MSYSNNKRCRGVCHRVELPWDTLDTHDKIRIFRICPKKYRSDVLEEGWIIEGLIAYTTKCVAYKSSPCTYTGDCNQMDNSVPWVFPFQRKIIIRQRMVTTSHRLFRSWYSHQTLAWKQFVWRALDPSSNPSIFARLRVNFLRFDENVLFSL